MVEEPSDMISSTLHKTACRGADKRSVNWFGAATQPPRFPIHARIRSILMAATVEVGTILIQGQPPRIAEVLGLESEPYLGNWSAIKVLDGFALDKKIRAAGWN